MTNHKHTRGPWSATRLFGGWWIEDDNPAAFCRRRIAIVDGGAGIESPEANARLIAAAPQMLALLEDINHELHVAMMDLQETGFSDGSSLPASLQLRLMDVVDKAKGEVKP